MTTLDAVVAELKLLPPPKLAEAVSFIRGLRAGSQADRLAALNRTAGVWRGEAGAAIERAIEDGCERIDARGW